MGLLLFFSLFFILPLFVVSLLVSVPFGGRTTATVALADCIAWIVFVLVAWEWAALHPGRGGDWGGVDVLSVSLNAGTVAGLIGFGVTLALRLGSDSSRKRVRQVLLVGLLGVVVVAVSLVGVLAAQRRDIERQEVPAVLKRVYEAEMSYSAGQPDKSFSCDPSRLPPVDALQWRNENDRKAFANWQRYSVVLECPYERIQLTQDVDGKRREVTVDIDESPHRFGVEAFYVNNHALVRFFAPLLLGPTVHICIDDAGNMTHIDIEPGPAWYQGSCLRPPLPTPAGSARRIKRIRVPSYYQQSMLVKRTEPRYPPLDESRIRNDVRFNVIIGEDGTVQDVRLLSGQPLLNEAAQEAVRQWVYRPTLVNGEPVEVSTDVTLTFHSASRQI